MSNKAQHEQLKDGRNLPPVRSQRVSGRRGAVSACGLLAVLIPLVAFSLSSAFSSLVGNTLEAAMRRNAADIANSWAQYFAGNFTGFDQVLKTGTLDTTQREFVAAAQQIGQVYRFRLFDARGRLVISSENARETADNPTRNDHDLDAVSVIESGHGIVRLSNTTDWPGAQAFTALAFVPVQSSSGERLGVVAVHVDQTSARAAFLQGFNWLSFELSALAVLVFLLPAFGFGWRSIQVRHAERKIALVAEAAEQKAKSHGVECEQLNRQIAILKNQARDIARQPQRVRKRPQSPMPVEEPFNEPFDDLVARAVESGAQHIPEWIGFECHLGLGDLAMAPDHHQLRLAIETLLKLAAANLASAGAPRAGSSARIEIMTQRSHRGIEVKVSGKAPDLPRKILTTPLDPTFIAMSLGIGVEFQTMQTSQERHGGGLDVRLQPGHGAEFVAWWPLDAAKREAA